MEFELHTPAPGILDQDCTHAREGTDLSRSLQKLSKSGKKTKLLLLPTDQRDKAL